MSAFDSPYSYGHFSTAVRRRHRYIHPPAVTAFLEGVEKTAKPRVVPVQKGTQFYRAQLGGSIRQRIQDEYEINEDSAHPPERMKPRKGEGREGRINPKGIPCLYVATTPKTAMSEVRPWMNGLVTVAKLELQTDVRLVDCSKYHDQAPSVAQILLNRPVKMDVPLTADEVEKAVWSDIDRAFSEPVTDDDGLPDYVPTQILAELFMSLGYDGIVYKSRTTEDGYNIALFDVDVANVVSAQLFQALAVHVAFRDIPWDEYFIRDDGALVRTEIIAVKPA